MHEKIILKDGNGYEWRDFQLPLGEVQVPVRITRDAMEDHFDAASFYRARRFLMTLPFSHTRRTIHSMERHAARAVSACR